MPKKIESLFVFVAVIDGKETIVRTDKGILIAESPRLLSRYIPDVVAYHLKNGHEVKAVEFSRVDESDFDSIQELIV